MLKELWGHLSSHRKKQFWMLLMLMVLASITEVISIGAIIPFLGIITAPEQVYQHSLMQPINNMLGITSSEQLLLPLTVAFMVAALVAGGIRLALLYVMTRLSYAAGGDLSVNIYNRTLYQEYSVHISRNSSEIINGIITKTNTVIQGVLAPLLILISSMIIIIAILVALFLIDFSIALILSVMFGGVYWLISSYTKKQLHENSQIIADQSTVMIKSLQEGLGGIRDVLIDGTQQFYCGLYQNADLPLRHASGNNAFIGASPRYLMEAIGMALIAIFAYIIMQQKGGAVIAVPVLGALALGAQRLLPSLQQAYSAYSTIKGSKASFEDVNNLLKQSLPDYAGKLAPEPIEFNKEVVLDNISFRYVDNSSENAPLILDSVNLKLAKGSRIGFIGVTGSGKSTLLDIFMGLLSPTSGKLTVDGKQITNKNRRAWQAHVAHVPQHIYLSDSTIEENIALGIPKEEIDHQLVEMVSKQAQISELIEGWEEGYQTLVGEQGIRLSGGQRQRIGIARALYKQANVLVFDEATSALDSETEQAVMGAVECLGRELTILIIAHRVSTLKGCDQIIKLDKNYAVVSGSYKEIIDE